MFMRGEEIPVFIGQSGPLNGQRWTISKTIVIGQGYLLRYCNS